MRKFISEKTLSCHPLISMVHQFQSQPMRLSSPTINQRREVTIMEVMVMHEVIITVVMVMVVVTIVTPNHTLGSVNFAVPKVIVHGVVLNLLDTQLNNSVIALLHGTRAIVKLISRQPLHRNLYHGCLIVELHTISLLI